jgi:hypothetical protein
MDQGAVPVKLTERVALLPLQIVVDPLSTAVGAGLTVTVPEAAKDGHLGFPDVGVITTE